MRHANHIDLAVLREARVLIASPANWTRFASARLPNGANCMADHPKAVKFGFVGAVHRAALACKTTPTPALCLVMEHLPTHTGIVHFSDTASHKEILAVLDKAIAKAERVMGETPHAE